MSWVDLGHSKLNYLVFRIGQFVSEWRHQNVPTLLQSLGLWEQSCNMKRKCFLAGSEMEMNSISSRRTCTGRQWFIHHLEFTDRGEESSSIGPQSAVLLTETKLHCEEVALEQKRVGTLKSSHSNTTWTCTVCVQNCSHFIHSTFMLLVSVLVSVFSQHWWRNNYLLFSYYTD